MINFDSIKSFLYMTLGFIVMGFIAVFKWRGYKIDSLKEDVKNHEAKDKKQDFEANDRVNKAKAEAEDANDIYPDGDYRL